jgi:hypothetical protein
VDGNGDKALFFASLWTVHSRRAIPQTLLKKWIDPKFNQKDPASVTECGSFSFWCVPSFSVFHRGLSIRILLIRHRVRLIGSSR